MIADFTQRIIDALVAAPDVLAAEVTAAEVTPRHASTDVRLYCADGSSPIAHLRETPYSVEVTWTPGPRDAPV